jgi:hypothetical protein
MLRGAAQAQEGRSKVNQLSNSRRSARSTQHGFGFAPSSRGCSLHWWTGGTADNIPSPMYGVDDDDASSAISIDWLVGVKGGDDDRR